MYWKILLIFICQDPTKAGDLYNLAAESAMACMKGKLANKYYMLAEEAYSLLEDEDWLKGTFLTYYEVLI